MSDILDQSEVDALLAAVETGELTGSSESSGTAGGSGNVSAEGGAIFSHSSAVEAHSVQDYDFKRPERVSKDQMRSLDALHESFARNLGASLSGLLRTIVECRVATIEQLTYSEFIHALPNPTCFNLVAAPPLEGQMCLELSPLIIYPIVDRLLGGSKSELFIPQRPLTSIEQRLVGRITDRALDCLTEAWADLANVEFELVDTESNPHLVQIVAPNEVVVVVGFELKMGPRSGTMSFCIPFNVIEPVISKLATQTWFQYARKIERGTQADRIVVNLKHAKVMLQCYLAETQITVHELLNLNAGDIIQTDKACNRDLVLQIEGHNKFAGRVGRFRGSRALKVTRIAEADERL